MLEATSLKKLLQFQAILRTLNIEPSSEGQLINSCACVLAKVHADYVC